MNKCLELDDMPFCASKRLTGVTVQQKTSLFMLWWLPLCLQQCHVYMLGFWLGSGFIQIGDMSLLDYVAVNPAKHATYVPHTAGRYSVKRFRKAQCPIVERLTNSLMMHGRNNGKKLMAVRIMKHAMEIIHLLTDQNPIQVIVDAVINRYTICRVTLSSVL